MVSLDQVLNIAIPSAAILFFAALFYSKMKEPINTFFRWIGRLLGYGKDAVTEAIQDGTTQVVYKYE